MKKSNSAFTLKIPYPASPAMKKAWNKRFGMNAYYAGKHWSSRREDAEYWHILVAKEMGKQKRRKPFEAPVVIRFLWNDRLDLSNHAVMAKMIEDALKGKVIIDDSRKYVKGISHAFHDEDYIAVIVEEIK